MIELAKAIVDFIDRQPQNVRKSLRRDLVDSFNGGPCWWHDGKREETSSVEELALSVFGVPDEMAAFWRCIHAIGVLDYVFTGDFKSMEQFQRGIPEEYLAQSPMMRQLALEAPLRRRYFEQAAAEWHQLRASSLSPEAFHEYMNYLMSIVASRPRPD